MWDVAGDEARPEDRLAHVRIIKVMVWSYHDECGRIEQMRAQHQQIMAE